MKSWFALVGVLLLAVPALCWPRPTIRGGAQITSELKPLPVIRLRDLDGKALAADSMKGKIVVLDFWATWCGPCISEVPNFNRIQEKYADKGVEVIGVTLASGEPKEVKPIVAKAKMKYTVLMGSHIPWSRCVLNPEV